MKEPVQNLKEAEPKIEVIFDFSVQGEAERVRNTLKKHKWYKERGYKPKYPQLIQEKLDRDEQINEDDVLEAVTDEFNQDRYAEQVAPIQEGWKEIENGFFENLETLGLPLQDKYYVCATRYGTGGSYGYPNDIQLNLEQKRKVPLTLAHEIVHLTIEPLIREYSIDHWTKERLVDLIMNKFFPEDQKLQRDPVNAGQILEIFNREFPDIKKVIMEVSKLKQ